MLCFYWPNQWLLGRNFPSGLLFHYRSLWRFFTSSDTFDARLCQKWGSGPEGFQGFRIHWELRDSEWGMLQMQKQEQYNMHIQQHEIPSLHFVHPPCCSWQRGSTCPSGIPQPQSFPAASTSEYCIPSSLFIDIPACRHGQSSFSRLIIWQTSKLGTQLLLLLKDKKGQQDKSCFACLSFVLVLCGEVRNESWSVLCNICLISFCPCGISFSHLCPENVFSSPCSKTSLSLVSHICIEEVLPLLFVCFRLKNITGLPWNLLSPKGTKKTRSCTKSMISGTISTVKNSCAIDSFHGNILQMVEFQ